MNQTIKRGSVTVKIYETPVTVSSGQTYSCHTVRWHFNGKTFNKKFGKKNSATRAAVFAETKAVELANGETAVLKLTDADAASYARARQLVEPLGVPLETAIADYVGMKKREREKKDCLPFPKIVELFVSRKKTDGTRQRHLTDIRTRLETLKALFPYPADQITAATINCALDRLQESEKWTNRTRNHYRAIMLNCCNYAKANHLLPREWNEFEYVPKLSESDGPVRIYTPDQVQSLLDNAPDDLLPALAIALFAGVRHSEIQGRPKDHVRPLDWKDINLRTGEVFIAEGKVRTAGQRYAHLSVNGRRWLRAYWKRSGPVFKWKHLAKRLARLASKCGVTWQHNGPRHSFISYRIVTTKNMAKVSEETGTDEKTLRKKYRQPVPQKVARAYFRIAPAVSGKVIHLKTKAA